MTDNQTIIFYQFLLVFFFLCLDLHAHRQKRLTATDVIISGLFTFFMVYDSVKRMI